MDSTTSADRRTAHRRVGAATIATFLVLLLLGATRGPAQAESTAPAPAPSQTVEPTRPQQVVPQDRGLPRDHGDNDDDGGGGFHGGGGGDGGGGGSAPAPSTGGSQT
jgi:uncharacterized membrane protein YgcG